MSMMTCFYCTEIWDTKDAGIEGCWDPDSPNYICPPCLEQISDGHHLDYDRASYDEAVARDVFAAANGRLTRAEYLIECLQDEECTPAAARRIRAELRKLSDG